MRDAACAALGVSCTDHLSFETSREKWLGRSRTADGAHAFRAEALDGGCGTVTDPVLSLRIRFRMAAGEEKTVRFVTAAAKSPEKGKGDLRPLARRRGLDAAGRGPAGTDGRGNAGACAPGRRGSALL